MAPDTAGTDSPPPTEPPPFDAAAVAALPPCEQGAVVPYAPLAGRHVWRASDFAGSSGEGDFIVRLSEAHVAELEAAVGAVLASGRVAVDGNELKGLTSVRLCDVTLPTLAPLLTAVGEEIARGRGFALLRRLPVERWRRVETLVAYYLLGLHWGAPMRQNERGHVIGHVKDVGVDPDCLNPNTRIYMTRAAQPWHVDSADAVALLCLSEAKEGGVTAWASSGALLNAIRSEAPELLPVLAGPWYMDRKGEAPAPGQGPLFEMPVLHYHAGNFLFALHDSYYQLAAAKHGGAAALSGAQRAALAKVREVAARPGQALRARLAPGDVQLLNNHTQIHSRSAYTDWEGEDGSKRHLLRLWLASPPPDALPLPACYRHLWRGCAADDRGLQPVEGGGWAFAGGAGSGGIVTLDAEVGQAHIPAFEGAAPPLA